MGSKRIPVSDLSALGKKHGQTEMILWTWDKETGMQHVVSWGKTKEHCKLAESAGNRFKKFMGWPDKTKDETTKLSLKEFYGKVLINVNKNNTPCLGIDCNFCPMSVYACLGINKHFKEGTLVYLCKEELEKL